MKSLNFIYTVVSSFQDPHDNRLVALGKPKNSAFANCLITWIYHVECVCAFLHVAFKLATHKWLVARDFVSIDHVWPQKTTKKNL